MNIIEGRHYGDMKVRILHLFAFYDSSICNQPIIEVNKGILSHFSGETDDAYFLECSAIASFDELTGDLDIVIQDCLKNRSNYIKMINAVRPDVVVCWGWSRSTYTNSMVRCFCEGLLNLDTREHFKPFNRDEAIGIVFIPSDEYVVRFYTLNMYSPNQGGFSIEQAISAGYSDYFKVYWQQELKRREERAEELLQRKLQAEREEKKRIERERLLAIQRFREKTRNVLLCASAAGILFSGVIGFFLNRYYILGFFALSYILNIYFYYSGKWECYFNKNSGLKVFAVLVLCLECFLLFRYFTGYSPDTRFLNGLRCMLVELPTSIIGFIGGYKLSCDAGKYVESCDGCAGLIVLLSSIVKRKGLK